ncbi:jg23489 [Pararge aegeria aegeria]|uniref:Jg23489 protein n=1 Tax=Pararge aegeria aegeria TaxID=348720 RepID=A0A8S4QXP7_9NEOP|nr:jg23489 [Pararge aegeria aegeria]
MKYRVIYEYEFHRVTSAVEMTRRITRHRTYGAGVAKENTVGCWCLQIKPRGGLETKVYNEELKAFVEAGPSQTTSELAAGCGVSDKTVFKLGRCKNFKGGYLMD